jgi:hypothetical protein
MVPRRRWISHTYSMLLWGHSLLKISSPGPLFYGTNWLLWRPHEQGPTFHSKCRINKGLIKKRGTINHRRLQCKGRISWPTPLTYIHSSFLRAPPPPPPTPFTTHQDGSTHWLSHYHEWLRSNEQAGGGGGESLSTGKKYRWKNASCSYSR